MGHFGEVPQASPCDLIQQGRIAPKPFVARYPAAAQGCSLDYVLNHAPAQRGLGRKGHVVRHPTRGAPLGVCGVADPFLRQVQAAIEQRIALRAGIGQKNTCLTVGRFAEFAAVLAFDPDRLAALFRKVAAIQNQHAVIVAQIGIDFRPQALQDGAIIPGSFTHKLLHGPDGIPIGPTQGQQHWFNRLARQLQQQPMQIRLRPLALLRPLQHWTEDRVKGTQFVQQAVNILWRQIENWRHGNRFQMIHALLPTAN